MATCRHPDHEQCPSDGKDAHGRCLGSCRDCDEHMLSTGRYTTYCPSCDVCATCLCPDVDGFSHFGGCEVALATFKSGNECSCGEPLADDYAGEACPTCLTDPQVHALYHTRKSNAHP